MTDIQAVAVAFQAGAAIFNLCLFLKRGSDFAYLNLIAACILLTLVFYNLLSLLVVK